MSSELKDAAPVTGSDRTLRELQELQWWPLQLDWDVESEVCREERLRELGVRTWPVLDCAQQAPSATEVGGIPHTWLEALEALQSAAKTDDVATHQDKDTARSEDDNDDNKIDDYGDHVPTTGIDWSIIPQDWNDERAILSFAMSFAKSSTEQRRGWFHMHRGDNEALAHFSAAFKMDQLAADLLTEAPFTTTSRPSLALLRLWIVSAVAHMGRVWYPWYHPSWESDMCSDLVPWLAIPTLTRVISRMTCFRSGDGCLAQQMLRVIVNGDGALPQFFSGRSVHLMLQGGRHDADVRRACLLALPSRFREYWTELRVIDNNHQAIKDVIYELIEYDSFEEWFACTKDNCAVLSGSFALAVWNESWLQWCAFIAIITQVWDGGDVSFMEDILPTWYQDEAYAPDLRATGVALDSRGKSVKLSMPELERESEPTLSMSATQSSDDSTRDVVATAATAVAVWGIPFKHPAELRQAAFEKRQIDAVVPDTPFLVWLRHTNTPPTIDTTLVVPVAVNIRVEVRNVRPSVELFERWVVVTARPEASSSSVTEVLFEVPRTDIQLRLGRFWDDATREARYRKDDKPGFPRARDPREKGNVACDWDKAVAFMPASWKGEEYVRHFIRIMGSRRTIAEYDASDKNEHPPEPSGDAHPWNLPLFLQYDGGDISVFASLFRDRYTADVQEEEKKCSRPRF